MCELKYIPLFTICALCLAGTATSSPIVLTAGFGAKEPVSWASVPPARLDDVKTEATDLSAPADWPRYLDHWLPHGSALANLFSLSAVVEDVSSANAFDGAGGSAGAESRGVAGYDGSLRQAVRIALSMRVEDAGAAAFERVLITGFGDGALLARQNGFAGRSQETLAPGDKRRTAKAPRTLFDSTEEEVATAQSPTIPEPATLFLLGTGLFGAGFSARHLNNRAIARERRRTGHDR